MIYVIDIPDDGSAPLVHELDDTCHPVSEALADGLSRCGYGSKLNVDPDVVGFLRRLLAAIPVVEGEALLV